MSRFMPILCLVLWTSLAGSAPAHADSTGGPALAAKTAAPAPPATPKIPDTVSGDKGDAKGTGNESAPPPAGAEKIDPQVMHAILCPAVIAFILFLIWLGLVVGYYVWAIRRYNVNYGLTDEEWKVLHPAMYANDDERAQYERRKAEMIAGSPQVGAFKAGEDPDKIDGPQMSIGGPFEEPRENPYKNDSFGLPPGTVRGTLALTAMVCVVLVEGVNLFSPVRLENHFEDLFTVFKMVVAFYFGSRALEVMEKKRAEVRKEETRAEVKKEKIKAGAAESGAGEEEGEEEADETPAPTGTTASAPASPASAAPATAAKPASSELARSILGAVTKHLPESLAKPLSKVLELPAEKPAVIEGFTAVRVPNIMASLSAVPPPAPAAPPAAVGTAGAGAATKPPVPPAPPAPPAAAALRDDTPLNQKVLALTAAFETGQAFPDCFGAVAGNFDGMGISYGALQWNLGQGTLQPLLLKAARNHESVMKPIFGNDLFAEILQILAKGKDEQLAWVKKFQITKQNPATGVRRVVLDPKLAEPLRTLGKTPQMIQIQVEEASTRYIKALSNCEQYQLTTERGVALMFDINVQNGLVDKDGAGAAIRHDYEALDPSRPEAELQEERMKIIATRRSDVVNPQWRADVLSRKMTIATGQGQVHGRKYDLAVFKLGLNPYTA